MAKAKEITIVNTGLCAIYIGADRILPDEELAIPEELLSADSIRALIASGELSVKDDSKTTKEIAAEVNKRRKRDPFEGKSIKELEDGGEFN
ncbi:hypothetical protein [Hafnia phage Pocis76]|uniref:Uncharacterized protein n=1 Tax=Hafnia phage Pocis76 TaxID=2831174 RepID=A0A8E7KY08_9CAUD|nr:hypothetical protein [Hafnia phage Pocis76]